MNEQVIVLNASYEPHQSVSLQHALKMLCRGVAVIEEAIEGRMAGPYPVPKILRLIKYVYVKALATAGGSPRYSRNGVLRRDNNECAYCTKYASTVDHVVPKSKGGKSSWTNVVAACRKCNEKKANKSLAQSGMKLLYQPFAPTFFQMAR
jgi:5-methylcytosine-specific restriction endonuclease McrA